MVNQSVLFKKEDIQRESAEWFRLRQYGIDRSFNREGPQMAADKQAFLTCLDRIRNVFTNAAEDVLLSRSADCSQPYETRRYGWKMALKSAEPRVTHLLRDTGISEEFMQEMYRGFCFSVSYNLGRSERDASKSGCLMRV